jgi:hypothetical protein
MTRIITIEQALLASMQGNCWYLSEHLVFLALADDDIELELKKSKILDKLLLTCSRQGNLTFLLF